MFNIGNHFCHLVLCNFILFLKVRADWIIINIIIIIIVIVIIIIMSIIIIIIVLS